MNEPQETNPKIAGRIEHHAQEPVKKEGFFIHHEKIKNLVQFTKARSTNWGGSIRQLIDKSIEIFENGPKGD